MARSRRWESIVIGLVLLGSLAAFFAWELRPRGADQQKRILSLDLMRRAARQGNPQVQYKLGQVYLDGRLLDRDFDQAAKWFSKAAEKNVSEAFYPLGYFYASGVGVKQDYKQAGHFLRLAAESGSVAAWYGLGVLFDFGGGTTGENAIQPNPDEALGWYRKAAEKGMPEAQCALADALLRREFTNDANAEAERWYRAAAKAGFAKAEFGLAMILDSRGESAAAESLAWYRKAAERGYSPAVYQLGMHYKDGRGVASDLPEAYYWMSLAASLGNSVAEDEQEALTKRLTERQIAAAKEAVLKWSPRVEASKKKDEPYVPLL